MDKIFTTLSLRTTSHRRDAIQAALAVCLILAGYLMAKQVGTPYKNSEWDLLLVAILCGIGDALLIRPMLNLALHLAGKENA